MQISFCFIEVLTCTLPRCCALSPHSFRYFIGDSFGRLSLLSLDHLKDEGLILLPLGEVSLYH